jgi:hypothetical protein
MPRVAVIWELPSLEQGARRRLDGIEATSLPFMADFVAEVG